MKIKNCTHHESVCSICFDMLRRGYRSEEKYFDDEELKPIKYKIMFEGKELKKINKDGVNNK